MKNKRMAFLIFFSVVLLVYGLANAYIYIRGYQALAIAPHLRSWYFWIFTFLSLSYIAARFLERIYLSFASDILHWVGAFWLGALLYFFLSVLIIDLVRLIAWFLPGVHLSTLEYYNVLQGWLLAGVIGMVFLLLAAGFWRARNPVVREITIDIPTRQATAKQVTLVMASDIHLGTLVGKRRLQYLIRHIQEVQPDIILFAGDLVDEDLAPVIRQNLGRQLQTLSAPLGVWAITGNHEYIGGAAEAVKYLETFGIQFLRDTAVRIPGYFWLAGREDRDKPRFSGMRRKPISEVLAHTDDSLPVILMDHQPFELEKTVEAGVALQVSGHTHHGQMWPFTCLTSALFEISHGYLKKGKTHFYVSSGFGTWGPPFRLGTRPEVVKMNVHLVPVPR